MLLAALGGQTERIRDMSKHTAEPWVLSRVDNGIGLGGGLAIDAIDDQDGQLFEICEVWGVDDDKIHDDRSRDNARRIVACVNACAGVQTETLEGIAGKGLFSVAIEAVNENEELKAVIKELELLARQAGNVAYNLGQSHKQWPSISETLNKLDAVRMKALGLRSK